MHSHSSQTISLRAAKCRQAIVMLTGIVLAALIVAPSRAQEGQAIRISPEQIRRAGIETSRVSNKPDAATDAGQHLSGTVVAPTNAITIVSSFVTGVVQQIHVNSLQEVQSATPVATLFSQQWMEMQREYLQLATQASLHQEKLARDEALYKEGIIALGRLQDSRGIAIQSDVAAKERYQTLRAAGYSPVQLASLRTTHKLSPYLSIRAGVRGTLLELDLHPGQRVEAGMPIARISQDSALWIDFLAARQQAATIRVGDLLTIKDCTTAKVIAISPQMNGNDQSTLIRAEASRRVACLKLNQFVEATHSSSAVSIGSLGVPASALVRHGAEDYVFLKTGTGFEAVRVTVVPGSAGLVWLTSKTGKLNADSQVASKGIVALKGAWIGLGEEQAAAPAKTTTTSGGK